MTLKMRFVTASGRPVTAHWTRGRPFAFSPRFHADSEHWYDQFKRLGLDGQSARSRGKAHIERPKATPTASRAGGA